VTARTHYRGLVKRRLVPLTIAGEPPAIDSDITWQGTVIGKSKTAAALTAPIAGEYEPTDTQSICLALLKLSDIHNILDAPACGDGPTTNSLMINGYAAVLALADWMQPLPHQAKSQG
jgi:hypothetical protein